MNKQEKIAEILGVTKPGDSMAKAMLLTFREAVKDEPEGEAAVVEAVKSNSGFVEGKLAALYDLMYSDDEVNALHSFTVSDTGKSLHTKSQAAAEIMFTIGAEWGEMIAASIMETLEE